MSKYSKAKNSKNFIFAGQIVFKIIKATILCIPIGQTFLSCLSNSGAHTDKSDWHIPSSPVPDASLTASFYSLATVQFDIPTYISLGEKKPNIRIWRGQVHI